MSTRPTAFARVPRGSKTGTTQPRKDLVRIDANFLERLERANMSPDLSTIMTKTSSTLNVEFNAQANVGFALVSKQGNTVADQADIKRIQTMSTSITKERKAALGEEFGTMTKFTLAAFVQKATELKDVPPIKRFHKGFVGVYRTVNTQFQTITKNCSAIESISTKGNGTDKVKNILIEMGRRISIAVGKYMFHRAHLAEDATAEKLNVFLFKERVPIWIFNKLSAAVIPTGAQGFDLRHLLFPKDPSKGVFLTFKEIRDVAFRNDLLGLLGGSKLVIQLATDDKLIRLMINLPTAGLDDYDKKDSVAQKLANTPFFLVPFEGAYEAADVFSFLAKNGVRGVTWASGTVLTPPDLLKFYGTIAKRMFYSLVIRPQNKAELLETMYPGFSFDKESDQLDIFAQLKAWSLKPAFDSSWFGKVRDWTNVQSQGLLEKVFNDVTMVSATHDIAIAFHATVTSECPRLVQGSAVGGTLIFTEVKNLALSLRERGVDANNIIGDRISLPQKKEKSATGNRAGVQERSRLSGEARIAVEQLRSRGYSALALRMQSWFRLFIDETVQEAVAAIFLARLDAFLETPLELSREDRQGFMEPDDPDEDLAPPDSEGIAPQNVPDNPDEN